jgi:hypothetical protein
MDPTLSFDSGFSGRHAQDLCEETSSSNALGDGLKAATDSAESGDLP